MTIKEVEKLTGLTAKAIRHYEKEGLINIGRNILNSYRNYSEQDVVLLKKIKIFRYMDFSVEEIKQILQMEKEKISDILVSKSQHLQEKNEENIKKKEMCLNLSNDLKKGDFKIEKYENLILFNEDEEVQSLLKSIEAPSFPILIFHFLIYIAPIIWLFINISMKKWDLITINSILAIIGTFLLTLECTRYFYWYKTNKKIINKNNEQDLPLIPLCIIAFLIGLSLFMIFEKIVLHFLAPENWLFYEFQSFHYLMIFVTMFPICCAVILLKDIIVEKVTLKEKIKFKVFIPCLLLWCLGIYFCYTNVTFVTEDSIICYSPLNITGETYSYNEVSKVEAKFGDKTFLTLAPYERKGTFQYIVHVDRKKIVFSSPMPNSNIERYYIDPNLELEEFDEKLMNLNIPKESSEANSDTGYHDKVYVERFLKIIRNK